MLCFFPHQYIFPFIHTVSIQLVLVSPSWSFVAVLTQLTRRGYNSAAGGGRSSCQQMTVSQTPKIPSHGSSCFFHEKPETGRKNIPYTQRQSRLRQQRGRPELPQQTDNGGPRLWPPAASVPGCRAAHVTPTSFRVVVPVTVKRDPGKKNKFINKTAEG